MLNIKKFLLAIGLIPKSTSEIDSQGELEVLDTDGKLRYHDGTSVSPVVTESHEATLTNKTFDANGAGNSISNIETADLASGVLNTDTALTGSTDTQIPSALAVKTYVDNSTGTISNDVGNLVTLSGVPVDSTNLGTFTGETIPDNQNNKEALQALETAHENHTGASTDVHSIGETASVVGTDTSQTLTNKTIDADNNSVSNIQTSNLKAGVLNTNTALTGASDTQLPSALAVKTYVDNSVAGKDDASEIAYSNTTSGLSASTVQVAIDEVDNNVDNLVTLSGMPVDSTNLGTFTGTTIPDNQTNKQALQALETSHESHTGASTNVHGIGAGNSVVGTGTSQALTNKTIDADLNTVSNIDNADIKVGANIARSKLASGTANRVVVNDASGVQSDAAAITAARALISDANGIPTHSTVTSTELGYVSGVSSAIQTQINSKVNSSGGTLTNGSIVTPSRLDTKQDTYANLVTYATTASNGQLVFATDTKEMYQVVDGFLKSVGGGAGGINYIDNGEFENNTTGWATYKDAAADSPADGTGGTANTTFTRTTSTPLRGNASGLITKSSGASRQGEGISYDFTIDAADKAQVLRISFDYNTEVSTTSYIDGNIRIYVYDVTNSRLIEVVDRDLYGSSLGKFVGTFQTSPDSVSYRLIFHIIDTSTVTAYTVKIDNVIVGPQTIVKGAIVTDWEAYTPVISGFGSGSTSLLHAYYRRVGDSIEITAAFIKDTVPGSGSSSVGVSIPNGLSVDFNKVTNGSTIDYDVIGTFRLRRGGTGNNEDGIVFVSSGSQFFFRENAATTTMNGSDFTAATELAATLKLPILGWSSNVVLSEDAGNREIVFRSARVNPTSASFAGGANLIFSSALIDTAAGYDSSTGIYTIPESGKYNVKGSTIVGGTEATNNRLELRIYQNSTIIHVGANTIQNAGLLYQQVQASTVYEFNKGDTVYLRLNTDIGTPVITSGIEYHTFEVVKLSSPQTIAASENVHLSLQHTSGQVIPNTTVTTLVCNVIVEDTHNAYNSTTGVWICPQSGYYQVSANLMLTNVTGWTEGESLTLSFLSNDTTWFRGYIEINANPATSVYVRPTTISGVIYISKGQNAYLQMTQGNDASVAMYAGSGSFNFFTITKVG